MQLLLSPDDLRSCPSSDLLIQSGCASRYKRRREKALKVLTFWQSAQPIETLSFIYIRCLASSPDSRTVAVKSVWEMRTRSPLSARDEWQKSWVLQCLFQNNLFSLFFSAFFTENPFFLQAESFTIPTRSRQLKHQLQEKFLWNAIKGIPPRQREREKGGSGSSVEWWMEISPALPFSLSLCHALPTSPDRSAIVQLFENTANHSMAADGERMWQDHSLSCTRNTHCFI